MRNSLVLPIESRDATLAKDSKLQNLMCDPKSPQKVMKRPGMWKSNLFAPTGQGFGITSLNNTIYQWSDANTATTPNSGTIDESLMAYSVTGISGSTLTLSPSNPFTNGSLVNYSNGIVTAGTAYIVTNTDGNDITIEEATGLKATFSYTSIGSSSSFVISDSGTGTVLGVVFNNSLFYPYTYVIIQLSDDTIVAGPIALTDASGNYSIYIDATNVTVKKDGVSAAVMAHNGYTTYDTMSPPFGGISNGVIY